MDVCALSPRSWWEVCFNCLVIIWMLQNGDIIGRTHSYFISLLFFLSANFWLQSPFSIFLALFLFFSFLFSIFASPPYFCLIPSTSSLYLPSFSVSFSCYSPCLLILLFSYNFSSYIPPPIICSPFQSSSDTSLFFLLSSPLHPWLRVSLPSSPHNCEFRICSSEFVRRCGTPLSGR